MKELAFGNPNRQHLIYLESENYLDSLISELSSYPPPPNESEQVSQEIADLIKATNQLTENEAALKRYLLYDTDFEAVFIKNLVDARLPEDDVKNLIIEIHKDIVPLLVKIKFTYNRPRPYQVALYKKMPLFVWRAKNTDSPSYPAGHCFQAKIYAEVIGNKYPQFYRALHELSQDIALSRFYLGAHYASDNEFASYMADIVLKHPEFAKKYKL